MRGRVFQIRGTSGSGKTFVMRQVMAALGEFVPHYKEGRKRPLYYRRGGILVLGDYDGATCGGCDGVGSPPKIYELIQELMEHDYTILCESLLLSEDVKWSSQLPNLYCIFLTTPLEQCLSQIGARRLEAGNEKPLNPDNTARRVSVIERARLKLLEAGAVCRRANSEQAVQIILGWLNTCYLQPNASLVE